jgi:nucleotide-binding universal stress UspA family protein
MGPDNALSHYEVNMFNIKNILLAIDLDAKNISQVIWALEIAKMFHSTIHIFYVNDIEAGFRHPTDREDVVALQVSEVASTELLDNQKIVYAVANGNLAKEIIKYCTVNEIGLIIVGHKHWHKIFSAFYGSPDINIIDAVKLPVLVILKA